MKDFLVATLIFTFALGANAQERLSINTPEGAADYFLYVYLKQDRTGLTSTPPSYRQDQLNRATDHLFGPGNEGTVTVPLLSGNNIAVPVDCDEGNLDLDIHKLQLVGKASPGFAAPIRLAIERKPIFNNEGDINYSFSDDSFRFGSIDNPHPKIEHFKYLIERPAKGLGEGFIERAYSNVCGERLAAINKQFSKRMAYKLGLLP